MKEEDEERLSNVSFQTKRKTKKRRGKREKNVSSLAIWTFFNMYALLSVVNQLTVFVWSNIAKEVES